MSSSADRKYSRFPADPNTLGYVCFSTINKDEFKEELVCLVKEEGYKGCGLIYIGTEGMGLDQKILIQAGSIGPLVARVAYTRKLEKNIYFSGVEYLD